MAEKYKELKYVAEDETDEQGKKARTNKPLIRKILLAFNMITYINSKNSEIRFPFFRFKINVNKSLEKQDWDLEHIHPQNSNVPEDKEEIVDYFKIMEEYFYVGETEEEKEALKELKEQKEKFYGEGNNFDKEEFADVYRKVNNAYGDVMITKDKQIGNLVLLSAEINRGYKNAPFRVKRDIIIKRDKNGEFIPICTKNAFLKYYSDTNRNKDGDNNSNGENCNAQTNKWTTSDRDQCFEKLVQGIVEYFDKVEEEYDSKE